MRHPKFENIVKAFNKENKEELRIIIEDTHNDIRLINRAVAGRFLNFLAGKMGEVPYQHEFLNDAKDPINHWQVYLYLESGHIIWACFVYVNDKHQVVEERCTIELLDENYDTVRVVNNYDLAKGAGAPRFAAGGKVSKEDKIKLLEQAYRDQKTKSVTIEGIVFKLQKPVKGYRGREFYVNGKFDTIIDSIDAIRDDVNNNLEYAAIDKQNQIEYDEKIRQGAKPYSIAELKRAFLKYLEDHQIAYEHKEAQTGSAYIYIFQNKKEYRFSDHERPYNSKWNFVHGDSSINMHEGVYFDRELTEMFAAAVASNPDKKGFATGGALTKIQPVVQLAPNGRPSKLTPLQYELVRTPEFLAWFGDWINDPKNASKVVDENGEPLVVYHGSKYDFNKFDRKQLGTANGATPSNVTGFFFSNKEQVAKSFGKKIYPVFLSLRTIKSINAKKKDYSEFKHILNDAVDKLDSKTEGVVIKNYIDSGDDNPILSDQYIVVDPRNIKLASGVNTAFDPSSDDIRFSKGGYVDLKKELLRINTQYNNQLKKILREETLPFTLELGLPRLGRLKGFLPEHPIQLSAKRLTDKRLSENHPFSLLSVLNMPESLADPLAVFQSRTREECKVILTDMESNNCNIVVAIEMGRSFGGYCANSVRSVYPKDNVVDILKWISVYGLMEYCHKEKVLKWLGKQPSNSADVTKLVEDSVKIVKAFKNPSQNFSQGGEVRKVPVDFDTDFDFNFGDKLKATGEIIVAHSTSSQLLPLIQKEGLKRNQVSVWEDTTPGKLYFEVEPTSSYLGENVYGWKAVQKYGGANVTLYVKVKAADLYMDRDDKALGARYRKNQKEYYKDVPPENILGAKFLWINVKREDFTEFSKIFKDEFEKGGIVAYRKGDEFKTGQPITIQFIKNPTPAPKLGKVYGQDVEPTGFYCTQYQSFLPPGWKKGLVRFESPLVIAVNENTLVSYKYELAKQYGKRGKALTNALKKKGYDGIVTVDTDYNETGEIIAFDTASVIVDRYDQGGTVRGSEKARVLLAPNGEPSRLSPTQHALVRTPEFLAWFGDWINDPESASKVVDENGEPLVVYHGTNTKFDVFKPSTAQGSHGEKDQILGMYFAEDREAAEWYALQDDPRFLKSVFLSVKNPFKSEDVKTLKSKLNVEELSSVDSKLKEQNYDGVILKKGFYTLGEQKLYLCFSPQQIKLADGSNTTFDSNSNDIRFQGGGAVGIIPSALKTVIEEEGYEVIQAKQLPCDPGEERYEVIEQKTAYELRQDYDGNIGDPISEESYDTLAQAEAELAALNGPETWETATTDHYAYIQKLTLRRKAIYESLEPGDWEEAGADRWESVESEDTGILKSFGTREGNAEDLLWKTRNNLPQDVCGAYDIEGQTLNLTTHGSGKYNTLWVSDEQENELGDIKLRIADHSYNPRNNQDVDLGFISVVIANQDETEDRFNGIHNLRYSGSDDYEDIVSAVKERIEEILSDLDIDKLKQTKMNFARGGETTGVQDERSGSVLKDLDDLETQEYIHLQLTEQLEEVVLDIKVLEIALEDAQTEKERTETQQTLEELNNRYTLIKSKLLEMDTIDFEQERQRLSNEHFAKGGKLSGLTVEKAKQEIQRLTNDYNANHSKMSYAELAQQEAPFIHVINQAFLDQNKTYEVVNVPRDENGFITNVFLAIPAEMKEADKLIYKINNNQFYSNLTNVKDIDDEIKVTQEALDRGFFKEVSPTMEQGRKVYLEMLKAKRNYPYIGFTATGPTKDLSGKKVFITGAIKGLEYPASEGYYGIVQQVFTGDNAGAVEVTIYNKQNKSVLTEVVSAKILQLKKPATKPVQELPTQPFYVKIKPFQDGDAPRFTRIEPDGLSGGSGTFTAGYTVYKTTSSAQTAGYLTKEQLLHMLDNGEYSIVTREEAFGEEPLTVEGLEGFIRVKTTHMPFQGNPNAEFVRVEFLVTDGSGRQYTAAVVVAGSYKKAKERALETIKNQVIKDVDPARFEKLQKAAYQKIHEPSTLEGAAKNLFERAREKHPALKEKEVVELADRIAAHDQKERDVAHVAEALQYLMSKDEPLDGRMDLDDVSSVFNHTRPRVGGLERREELGILTKEGKADMALAQKIWEAYSAIENPTARTLIKTWMNRILLEEGEPHYSTGPEYPRWVMNQALLVFTDIEKLPKKNIEDIAEILGDHTRKLERLADKTDPKKDAPLSYTEAIKMPAGGAQKMTQAHLQAQAADAIARKHGMQGKAVYEWANQHGINLAGDGKVSAILSEPKNRRKVLDDVLSGQVSATKELVEASKSQAGAGSAHEEKIRELKLKRIKLLNKALKAFPKSPMQLKIRAEIDEVEKEIAALEKEPGKTVAAQSSKLSKMINGKKEKPKKQPAEKEPRSKLAIELDKQRKALKPGKRTSANGNTYYENRDNRSDEDRRKKI